MIKVYLNSNICISENFNTPTKIAALQRTLTEKCSFDEPQTCEENTKIIETHLTTISQLKAKLDASISENLSNLQKHKELEKQLKELKAQYNMVKQENILKVNKLENDLKIQEVIFKNSRAELVECKAEKTELKLDLKTEKIQCSKQLDYIKELHQDLKAQYNATYNAELKELRNNLQFKLEEIDELREKLQQKEMEIIEKKQKIEALEKKIQVFGQF